MNNDKKPTGLVILKSALKKATLGAVVAGGLLLPTAHAGELGSRQSLEQRVMAVSESLRAKLVEQQGQLDATAGEASVGEELQGQWGNAWYNWNNWNNWHNWFNWGNWGNWLNS
jgi:hypothetical protein